ncbi:MAG: CHAD domain-containing protein, partial [Parachlamydia sp.]|nr:CHAD domain-containing protein [Parachlamydia sp.]
MIATADSLTNQILKINVQPLKKGSKGRHALEPEAIHDKRVATRRIRAALKTFKTLFPPRAKELSRDLQQLDRLLGKKRDLDVFLSFIFKTLDAKLTDFPKLAKQLAEAGKPILAIFKSTRFANLMKELEHLQPTKRYN